jgi:hypothetical protein
VMVTVDAHVVTSNRLGAFAPGRGCEDSLLGAGRASLAYYWSTAWLCTLLMGEKRPIEGNVIDVFILCSLRSRSQSTLS